MIRSPISITPVDKPPVWGRMGRRFARGFRRGFIEGSAICVAAFVGALVWGLM